MPAEMAGIREPVVQAAVAQVKVTSRTRLFYIDNLRVALITFVIVGHIAITYGAPIGNWYYIEEGEVGTLFAILTMLLLGIGAAFLLGLFYMISGYFTPPPYDRKGAGPFILDRLKRLGIPLLLYAFVINPLVTYWAAVHGGYVGSFWQYVPSHLPQLQEAAVGPLWFVEALLVFSLVYALGRMIIQTFPSLALGSSRKAHKTSKSLPSNRSIALFAFVLGLATFLVRIWAPFGWWWEPLHQEPAHFPQYIAMFAVGIIAYRNDWFARIPSQQARLWMWAALACVPLLPVLIVAAGVLSGEVNPDITGGFNGLSLAYSLWEGFMGTAMIVTVMIWFRDRFNRQGKLLQQMSAASYAVYVLHPLLIVPLTLALSEVQLNLSLKFTIVAPPAVTLCFLAGHYFRKLPLVRNFL